MAMGRRITSKCTCILVVSVILAIMVNESNCEATRHLLQITSSNETLIGDTAVINVGGLTGSETLISNITVIDVGALTGFLNLLSGNSTLNGSITGTLNGVGGFTGFLTLRNGTLNGSLQGAGPLNDVTLSGTSRNGTVQFLKVKLIGVGTLNNVVNVPLSGSGTLTLLTVFLDGTFVGTLNAILAAILG